MKRYQATPREEINAKSSRVYMSMELSLKKWKLGFSDGRGRRPRVVTIPARDWGGMDREIEKAKKRFGLGADSEVWSCYEAGQDGFWIHRKLEEKGIRNLVVDAASIQIDRRAKQVKTDRTDAVKLVEQLVRYLDGEGKAFRVVRVPSREAEEARQLHRDLEVLKRERTQHKVRIQMLLRTVGIYLEVGVRFKEQLDQLRCGDGAPLGKELKARVSRELARWDQVRTQILDLERQQRQAMQNASDRALLRVRELERLCGIGLTSSWVFTMEFFGWRQFQNGRQVGAATGLAPMPYQSGESNRDQGISHAGNRRIRTLAVEIAWSWLRYQPQSALSRWYQQRFATGSARMRKVGIVALARKLMIAFWRYLEFGVVPEGARFKTV